MIKQNFPKPAFCVLPTIAINILFTNKTISNKELNSSYGYSMNFGTK